jgi:hypothetical protein
VIIRDVIRSLSIEARELNLLIVRWCIGTSCLQEKCENLLLTPPYSSASFMFPEPQLDFVRGDTVPGLGKVTSIVRWGNSWVVCTENLNASVMMVGVRPGYAGSDGADALN